MRTKFALALLLLATASAHAQTATTEGGKGVTDTSANTQCWDVLQNVARDKPRSDGKLSATGDYDKQQSGSSEDRKVQGPGAEPKDSTGVTVGESNAAQQRSGASVRPSGLPNC